MKPSDRWDRLTIDPKDLQEMLDSCTLTHRSRASLEIMGGSDAPDLNAERIPYPEYVLRILFASFYPAVKMAVHFNYPLDTVKDMMTLALAEGLA